MKKLTFEIYRDKKKEWRWRLKSRNGRIIAESGEGYKRKEKATRIFFILRDSTIILKFKS